MQLSIVIPFYNSSSFLIKCLKSFKKINKETEIILINDGSSDNPNKIIDVFKRNKNYNIRYISLKKNKGVSFCRNLGISKAKGKYVYFIDSDDQLFKNTLTIIHKNLKKFNKDIFVILSKSLMDLKIDRNQFLKRQSKKSLFNNINKFELFRATCWNFIIKKELVTKNKIYFGKSKIFEDQIFVTKVLLKTKSFKLINDTYYGKGLDNVNSLSKKVGKIVTYSCFENLTELNLLLKNKKIKKDPKQIKFIKSRINFFTKELELNSLITSNKDILNFDKKHNLQNLKVLKANQIIKSKKKRIDRLNKNLKIYKKKKIIIFCAGTFSKIIITILRDYNFEIIFCIDSNKYLHGESLFSIPIFEKNYVYKNMKNFNTNPLLICNRSLKATKAIKKEVIFNKFREVRPIKL